MSFFPAICVLVLLIDFLLCAKNSVVLFTLYDFELPSLSSVCATFFQWTSISRIIHCFMHGNNDLNTFHSNIFSWKQTRTGYSAFCKLSMKTQFKIFSWCNSKSELYYMPRFTLMVDFIWICQSLWQDSIWCDNSKCYPEFSNKI